MKLAFELEVPDGAINTDMGADLGPICEGAGRMEIVCR
jgi:hypothetical protein